ncbi:UNVERIFIED_CONTAM: hypothetical protein PYX00_000478 [Menopon gallinae]|uniref:Uncharacterized protein n=1 Tax=Menopon gallinae TaxID=328185 RepID=A0AAW2I9A4_9NEOP
MYEESGRATAPQGVRYNVQSGSSNEGYTHTVATTTANLAEQIRTASIQSPQYTPSYSNFAQQRPQASPRYTPTYSPSSPSPNYSSLSSKVNPSLPSQSPQYTPSYTSSSHIYSPSFGSSTFSSYNNANSNFELPSTSSSSTKSQQSYLTHENNIFPSSEHISSTLFNIPKSTKTNSNSLPRYSANYSNFSYFSNNQPKYSQSKNTKVLADKQKSKSEFEIPQKLQKSCKDETEFNCNIGDLQQFLSKHGSKIKNSSDSSQDSVTDSLLNFLQRKTYEKSFHDNFPYESSDINQVLVSICSKSRSEEVSDLKKKDDETKSINDLLPKVFAEKEEKRGKNVEERKKSTQKEILDEITIECEEKKTKRDAMSHYQEDKSHKRPPNYGDFNQWDYLNAQDIQASSNHGRRGIPFCGSSQSHSMAWNPMGMPHQTNPYYSNPHGHVLPAHAHTEYRYNQWNNPNHKNVTNIQNAHSQNAVLAQSKLDVKHNTQNSIQDFGLQMNSDYSKVRNSPHDMVLRTPTPDASRSIHSDYSTSISPALKNPPLRTPPPVAKSVISNPLTDLQMLVTNQDTEKLPEKPDVYQLETVDLSAHSDVKQKESADDKDNKVSSNKDSRSPVSVIQTKPKVSSESDKAAEKPVELTAKPSGKSDQNEKEISSTNSSNKSDSAGKKEVEDKKEESSRETDLTVIKTKTDENTKNTQKEQGETGKTETTESSKSECDIAKMLERLDGSNAEEKSESKKPENGNSEMPATSSNEVGEVKREEDKGKASDEKSEPEKKLLMEVESDLQILEGVGEENNDLPTVSSTSVDVKPSTSESTKKTARKRPSRTNRSARLSSGQSSGSENHSQKKKSKCSKSKEENRKKMKKSLYEMDFARRGPVLHLEGPRDSPSSVMIVNYPKGDDEDEKDKSLAKKQILSSNRSKHHNELDYKGRSKNGLFSSTLSARYDAQTTDYTWICVFLQERTALQHPRGPLRALHHFQGREQCALRVLRRREGHNRRSEARRTEQEEPQGKQHGRSLSENVQEAEEVSFRRVLPAGNDDRFGRSGRSTAVRGLGARAVCGVVPQRLPHRIQNHWDAGGHLVQREDDVQQMRYDGREHRMRSQKLSQQVPLRLREGIRLVFRTRNIYIILSHPQTKIMIDAFGAGEDAICSCKLISVCQLFKRVHRKEGFAAVCIEINFLHALHTMKSERKKNEALKVVFRVRGHYSIKRKFLFMTD